MDEAQLVAELTRLAKDIERLQQEGSKRYGRIGSEIESLRSELRTMNEDHISARRPWSAPAFILSIVVTIAGVAFWAGQSMDNTRRLDAIEGSLVPRIEFEVHLRVARERQDQILERLTSLDNKVSRFHQQ
jgi:hypothetical protein